MKEKLLIVDDEADILHLLEFALTAEGFGVTAASNGRDALEKFHEDAFDLVLTDIRMPVMDGMELLNRIREADEYVEIIVLTGHGSLDYAIAALKNAGAYDFFQKPLEDIDHLLFAVKNALEHRRLRMKNREVIRDLHKLSQAVHQSPGAVVISNFNGEVEYVNPKFTEITGYGLQDVAGSDVDFGKAALLPPACYDDMLATLGKGKVWRGEFLNRKKTGEEYWETASVSALRNGGDAITHLIKVAEDVTERKRAEAALKASEQFNAAVLDSLPAKVVVIDNQGAVLKANQAWKRFVKERYGKSSEIKGRNLLEICPAPANSDDEAAQYAEALDGVRSVMDGKSDRFEKEFQCPAAAAEEWFLLQATRLNAEEGPIVVSYVDITPLKLMERRIVQSQRMEAVATLSGGIAHEFNNNLAALMGFIELLELDAPLDEKTTGYMKNIKSSCFRMSELAQQLLAYSRGGKYFTREIALADFVSAHLPALKAELAGGVRLETRFAEDRSKVNVDVAQFEMTLVQLFKNAEESFNKEGGRITVATGVKTLPGADAEAPYFAPGRYAFIAVADNGAGMDEKTRNRIFEPFFTTKFTGRGLGMAAVYGIVKNHGGYVTVNSKPAEGTTVCIYLPALEQ